MGSKQATPPRTNDPASESELENRAKSLSKFLKPLDVDDRAPHSRQPHALDPLSELKVKVEATYNMLRVAKLLREPARQSLLSKVRESLDDLERIFAANFEVEMTSRHET
jgi:hypothetical protein